jgi:hypothetical protein
VHLLLFSFLTASAVFASLFRSRAYLVLFECVVLISFANSKKKLVLFFSDAMSW